jgi:hypothetical protein
MTPPCKRRIVQRTARPSTPVSFGDVGCDHLVEVPTLEVEGGYGVSGEAKVVAMRITAATGNRQPNNNQS